MMESINALLLVRASVESSVEDAWNKWYDDRHLPEILSCPGFVSARRFVAETESGREYIAIYQLESAEAVESEAFAMKRGWEQFAGHVDATVRVFRPVKQGE